MLLTVKGYTNHKQNQSFYIILNCSVVGLRTTLNDNKYFQLSWKELLALQSLLGLGTVWIFTIPMPNWYFQNDSDS